MRSIKHFERLKKLIEQNLKGEIDVELHQAGTLFSQKTEIQGLQLGSTHLIAPTTGIYSSISKKINAILLPSDMKGLKIRVQPADIFVKTMKAFGANVISMNWGEVPAAIQQGVIDAAEPTPNATKWNWEATAAENEAAYKVMSDYGVQIHQLTPEQRQKWVDAVKPVWQELGNKVVGDEVMNRLKTIGGVM